MSDLTQQLKTKVAAGRIIFDADNATTLQSQLFRTNSGTQIVPALQTLILDLCDRVDTHLRISSLVRSSGHHGEGRAVDFGNEEIAASLLPQIATDAQVAALGIDELIFDAAVAGETNRNKWNYDRGIKHNYNTATLDQHRNHIHISVKA